ncbi:MAG: MoxR family ATPase [Bacteroidia bacterium]|jgi:MoxR-like ATPase|nr:MoxR family ATPase [Bacteroidia bacterium]
MTPLSERAFSAADRVAPEVADKIDKIQRLLVEMEKVVVGQQRMVHRLLIGIFSNGHVLLEGVPGLAKTLTVSTLAQALQLNFKRIQFTPDLLPADLIGTMIYNQAMGRFEVKKGPIFSHIVLADEINRSPAKVQSALLEAMQEHQVTIGENTFALEEPFLVLATQNPIDQEGTYPLPEAQVDRFMMKVFITYPSRDEEKAIMRRMARTRSDYPVGRVLTRQDITEIRELVDQVQLSARLEDYIVDIVMATRNPEKYRMPKLQEFIEYGASPRASLALCLGAKAHAFLEGRNYVLPEDVKAIAPDVLNHRIILTYEAEAEEFGSLDCIDLILRNVEI